MRIKHFITIRNILMIMPILVIVAISYTPHEAFASVMSGKVTILDGDTIVFKSNPAKRIRIFGISAAEMSDYTYGLFGRTVMDSIINNQSVNCKKITKDRYNRTVAICYLKGKDIAQTMLRRGAAITYRAFLLRNPKILQKYLTAENLAKKESQGLWKKISQLEN